jgi:hypothetical protein
MPTIDAHRRSGVRDGPSVGEYGLQDTLASGHPNTVRPSPGQVNLPTRQEAGTPGRQS